MNYTVEQVGTDAAVTIWKLEGELDASNYVDVMDQAKKMYDAGTRNLLLDLSELTFMSSSGLVALHGTVLIMRGLEAPDPDAGWGAFHDIERDVQSPTGFDEHCKLLSPQPRVTKVLEISGFDQFLEIYSDRNKALASFV